MAKLARAVSWLILLHVVPVVHGFAPRVRVRRSALVTRVQVGAMRRPIVLVGVSARHTAPMSTDRTQATDAEVGAQKLISLCGAIPDNGVGVSEEKLGAP